VFKEEWLALANQIGYANEKQMFEDLYSSMPIPEIARRLSFSTPTIARRMGLLGIVKRSRGGSNNLKNQKFKIWRVDQRIVFLFPVKEVAHALRVSDATLYNYKAACKEQDFKKGVQSELLHYQSNSGPGPVCN